MLLLLSTIFGTFDEFRNFRSMSFGARRLVTKRLRIDVAISFRGKRRLTRHHPNGGSASRLQGNTVDDRK